jgi:hypothetical protein
MRNPMRHFLIIFLVAISGLSFGQTFNYPKIIKTGDSIQDFIPKNWTILDSVTGMLNNRKVYALVLQFQDTAVLSKKMGDKIQRVKTFPRTLLVIIQDSVSGKLVLNTQNNKFIPTVNEVQYDAPDSYNDIVIEKGILKLDFTDYIAPRVWSRSTYKFRLKNNSFTLIGADVLFNQGTTGDSGETSYNFLTKRGIEIYTPYSLDKDRPEKSQTTNFKMEMTEFKTLNDMTEFNSWEVAKNRFL